MAVRVYAVHARVTARTGIRVRAVWLRAADTFWTRAVRPAAGQRVLGVHIRGTDARSTKDTRGSGAAKVAPR